MRRSILTSAVFLTACTAPPAADDSNSRTAMPPREEAIMTAIESNVTLPAGAEPLSAYGRYYRDGDAGQVVGIYIIPSQSRGVVAGPTSSGLPPHLPAGERRWMRDATEVHDMMDGGCAQVNIVYDPAARKFLDVKCNGEA